MGFVAGDRVKETSTTTGTGAKTLAGATSGFQAISSIPGIIDGDYLILAIVHQSANEWETGLYQWASGAGTVTALKIFESSNADAAVNFSAGTKDVFCVLPAQSGTPSVNRRPKGNVVIPAGHSLYVSKLYEIPSGVSVEIDADAVLEVG